MASAIINGCASKPSKEQKIVTSVRQLNSAQAVQIDALLTQPVDSNGKNSLGLYNYKNLVHYYASREYEAVWSNKGEFSKQATQLKAFIDGACKAYGLFSKSYHKQKLNDAFNALANAENKKNAELWAKADLLLTDAFFQICKHVQRGRLYTDTNYKYFDSTLQNTLFVPSLSSYASGGNLDSVLQLAEPRFAEYQNLKKALQNLLTQNIKTYAVVSTNLKDTASFIKSLLNRLHQEGYAKDIKYPADSAALSSEVKRWQLANNVTANGIIDKDLVAVLNQMGSATFEQVALNMDRLRNNRIANNGNYVLVNIPSYYLQGYENNVPVVESKVAVGKIASKTPVMESEISEVIVMPMWFVPPSILKIPGWLDRHRNNPNFVVRGKTAVQKSGPGNALGNMKFNFKSGDAIYLHDTNERWAFGSSKRAVSHGCVRVQNYAQLANFIASITPVYEKRYKKIIDKVTVDSLGDSTIKYKYVVSDSTVLSGDSVFSSLLKKKSHREISLVKKVPIYINYLTCVARNGSFVKYADVYSLDQAMINRYFGNAM